MPAPRWRVAPAEPASAAALAAALDVTPITAQILLNRGLRDPGGARGFLEASLDRLSDPETIVDVPVAVERIARAISAGEPITIYGDYDADGVTATAIQVRGLRSLGGRVQWFVPSRFAEGYGLNGPALARLREQGQRLIIAVDCGVTAVEEIAEARAARQEIIVVDHHEPLHDLPPAVAVIDPKRADAPETFREYSAAGLAFQLLRAVRRRLGQAVLPEEVIDLAALGTVADVVPLVDDNRVIARAGLQRMLTAPTAGVAALIRVCGITGEVTSRHVGFSLAPRLNAAGRLGDAGQAVRLLLTEDAAEADGTAATLDAENRARQQLCEQILSQAIEQVEQGRLQDAPAIVLAGDGWHPGVIGIVASQLVERYYRPVVLMAVADGVGKGSARSIGPFHMVDALGLSADLLTRYGGHAMAAGLTIDAGRIAEFTRRFTETAGARLRPEELVPTVPLDAEVSLSEVTETLARELHALAPFGAGNPEPVLAVRGVQAVSTRVMGDGAHLRMGVTDGAGYAEAVGFRLGDASELLAFTQARLDLAFTVSVDRWDDRERVQLIVRDLQTPGVDLETVLTDSRLLVDRLFARAEDYLGDGALGIEEADAFNTKVAGVTFEGRQDVARTLAAGNVLRLQREPGNPVDPHAIRVLTADGRQVGFLSARIAARLAPSMDTGTHYVATVSQLTGGPTEQDRERSFGVNIFVQKSDMPPPELDPTRFIRTSWKALPLEDLLERFRIHLRGGRTLGVPHLDTIRAVDTDRAVLGVFGPGRGRLAVLTQAAAAKAIRSERLVVLAMPLRGQVERVHAEIGPLLARIGLRVLPAHGALMFRRRQRLLQALSQGTVDVVVASIEYLRHAPPALRPGLVLLECDPAVDADAFAGALERLGQPPWSAFASSVRIEGVRALQAMAHGDVRGDVDVRTNLRLVDRRSASDRMAVLAEAVARRDRTLVRVGTRHDAVETARALREQGIGAAYTHGGLPLRVRDVLVQALADGRIGVLVAADGVTEDAMPPQLKQIILAGLPRDRAELAEWIGATGSDGRAATVMLLYGRDDVNAAQAALAEIHPSRETLAAIFRAIRERLGRPGGVLWPDEDLTRTLGSIVPSPRTIGIGLDVLAEAGVIQREYDGERWRIALPEDGSRRDLTVSMRYTEGTRERQELAALAAFAFGPLHELLHAAAGGGREAEDRSGTR